MITRDILRIALLVLFIAFALKAGSRSRIPGPLQINSPAESEDTETEQLLQRLKDIRDKNRPAVAGQERKKPLKEIKDFSSGVYFSAGAVLMIIALLMALL